MFMPGSVFFGGATFFQAAAVTGAFNGTSLNGTQVQLGQLVAALGDPGKLIAPVEIPLNGFNTSWRQTLGLDTVTIAEGAIQITGNPASGTGSGGALFAMFDGTGNYTILMNGVQTVINFDAATMVWKHAGSNQLVFSAAFVSAGGGTGTRATAVLAETFHQTDGTMICNTTAGNMSIAINPTTIPGQQGSVLKQKNDFNTITLTVTSGVIWANGVSGANFVITGAGESVDFISDGTNIFIK
jgi:hypothetical protein